MPALNASPDILPFAPALVLLLRDAVTGANTLAGDVDVTIGAAEPLIPNPNRAMFVFVQLANGSYVVKVRSTEDEPYYLPLDIVVKLPFARPSKSLWAQPPVWTGIPDLVLADPTKLLDDPEQTSAYQAQRAQTLLLPATSYPFPAGSTLVRGLITGAGAPLSGALITNDLVAQAGQFAVIVVNPAGPSSAGFNLTVVNAPVVDSLEPSTVLVDAADFTLNIVGSGYVTSAVVKLAGNALPSTVMSSGFITAQVTAAQVGAAGALALFVANPDGTTSSPHTLTVASAPAITGLNPTMVTAAIAGFTLTVQGSGFNAASVVEVNAAPLATTYVNSTTLTAFVPAAAVAGTGALSVIVTPGGAGTHSNSQTLTVVNTPVINSLDPSTVIAAMTAFTLSVQGTGYVAGATASVNGIAAPTAVLSSTQLTVQITAAQIAAPGQLPIIVTNPSSAASNAINLSVSASPVISAIDPATVTSDSTAFTIMVQGSGFMPGAFITLNGIALQTTVVNSTQLHALVPRSGYTTGPDGTFVLFFDNIPGRSQDQILIATHPGYPNPKLVDVTVLRGGTVSVDIDMSS